MRSRMRRNTHRRCRRTRPCWSTCRAAATRTCTRSLSDRVSSSERRVMRDEFDEPQPTLDTAAADTRQVASGAEVAHPHPAAQQPVAQATVCAPLLPTPATIGLRNCDFLTDAANLPDQSIDLILAD